MANSILAIGKSHGLPLRARIGGGGPDALAPRRDGDALLVASAMPTSFATPMLTGNISWQASMTDMHGS